MGDLTENFDSTEFTCKCGCGSEIMDVDFINRLQLARSLAGIPFEVRSGRRCIVHNRNEGGEDTSDHLSGEGVDIEAIGSMTRFKILEAAFKVHFLRIGIGKTYIHLGSAGENPQEVVWLY